MVPLPVQKQAMGFLKTHIFTTPKWLVDTLILARVGESPTQTIGQSQDVVLQHLFGSNTLSRIAVSEAMYGNKAYRLIDYFNDIDNIMWTELKTSSAIDIYRRNLQRSYVEKVMEISNKSGKDYRDVAPILKVKLAEIHSKVKKALLTTKDPMTVYHLKYIEDRLADVI